MAKPNNQESLTAVGPGADEHFVTDDDEQEAPPENEQRRQTSPEEGEREDDREPSDQDEDEAPEDERAGHSEEEEEGSPRERQRQKRARQHRNRKERWQRDQTELRFLRQRNEHLERQFSSQDGRITQTELATIDGRIQQTQDQIRQADEVIAEAITKGNGEAAAEATRLRDELRDGLTQLKGVRTQTAQAAQQRTRPESPQADPRIQSRAREWAAQNRWFDPTGADEASAIAYAIERRLFGEGRLDPTSDEYWDEVDRRVARRLPEVAGSDEAPDEEGRRDPPRKNGNGRAVPRGPVFRTGGRERTLRRGEVYVDSERRKAMEESGAWDDPVLRERYLKSYQKYDREHGRRH